MATHKKEVSLTDLQQTILSNDLYNDTDNAGIDKWVQDAVDGKINACWKRMQRNWTTRLMDDPSFTDPIPSNQADFDALVTANKTFLTSILIHFSGRNFVRFVVVIQAAALVFKDKFLYLMEFRKVISFLLALINDSKPYISMLFLFTKSAVQPIVFTISFKGKGPFFS